MIRLPCSQLACNKLKGNAVDLPAPGSACSTRLLLVANRSDISVRNEVMGKEIIKAFELNIYLRIEPLLELFISDYF